jgi:transposase
MSRKEAPRPGLLKAARKGKLTNQELATAIKLTVRQVRRLRRRYEQAGAEGLVHRLRGRPSNRRLLPALRQRVAELMTTTYLGLNDCHLTEKLHEREGLPVSRSTVRRLRRELGRPAKRHRQAPHFLPDFAARFALPPRDPCPAWRPAPRDLDRILACRYRRVVARDSTVSIPGRLLQLPRGACMHGARVELRELLDGRLLVLRGGRLLAEQPAPPGPFVLTPRDARRRRRLATLGIELQGSPRNHDRPTTRARAPARSRPQPTPDRPQQRPAANHIWRRSYDPLTSPLTR